MLATLIASFEHLALTIPLPWFVAIGSFLEELIAPIPSPLIMTSAGTILLTQGMSLPSVIFIAMVGAATKTAASLIYYYFGDKAEDVLVGRFGTYLKISHADTEGIGKYFNNSRRDDVVLFVLRAIPLFPNAPVSLFCGIIKQNIRTYVAMTFGGTTVKNLIYITVGIYGLGYLGRFQSMYGLVEQAGYLMLGAIAVVFVYRHLRQAKT